MFYIALPLLVGIIIGFFSGYNKKIFVLSLLSGVVGIMLWVSTSVDLGAAVASAKASGLLGAGLATYDQADRVTQLAVTLLPAGFIIGIVFGKIFSALSAGGKHEDKRTRKLRILREHGMTEFQ